MASTDVKNKLIKLINPSIHTPSFIGAFLMLYTFWVLITWRLDYQYLITGFVAAYFLTRFNNSLILQPKERFAINKGTIPMLVRYLGYMIVAIVKANIDVAKIVLQRKMPISPGLVKFRSEVQKDFTKVMLANSITLTPGTLTIDLEDDVYVVHCLTRENADEVVNWDMEKELIKLEKRGMFSQPGGEEEELDAH